MKKAYVLLGILFAINAAFPEAYAVFLKTGDTPSILENSVNLRDGPDLKSRVISTVTAGERVTILDRLATEQKLYGITAPWYKIEWNGSECYVWGGVLSTEAISGDFDGDGSDDLLLSRMETDQKDEYSRSPPAFMVRYSFERRLISHGRILSASPIPGSKKNYNGVSIIKDIGLSPNIAILDLSFSFGDGNDGFTNHFLYFWDGASFANFAQYEYSISFDESTRKEIVRTAEILGPKDNGKKNLVQFVNKVIEKTDEKQKTEITSIESFHWDEKNKKFILVEE